jgi:hypothetical protein
MHEPVQGDFPQQCIQSQDNKKRPHAGGHAPILSTEQSFQTQDNKRKHHAPAHAFLINQIFLLSNGPGNHFHGRFDTVILSLEMLKLSPQNIISKNKNFVKEN